MLDFSQQTYRIAYALNAGSQHFDMDLMRNLIAELKPAKRLSITFRFQPASVALDSRAMSDIKRLRDLLVTPAYAKKTVLLVGFADAVGGWGSNLRIAERRATTVARALTSAGIQAANVNLATRAYGELAPVSCNDSLEARNLNRRVEVWIKD
jgi:phosphate transport system substrate-binding protein